MHIFSMTSWINSMMIPHLKCLYMRLSAWVAFPNLGFMVTSTNGLPPAWPWDAPPRPRPILKSLWWSYFLKNLLITRIKMDNTNRLRCYPRLSTILSTIMQRRYVSRGWQNTATKVFWRGSIWCCMDICTRMHKLVRRYRKISSVVFILPVRIR